MAVANIILFSLLLFLVLMSCARHAISAMSLSAHFVQCFYCFLFIHNLLWPTTRHCWCSKREWHHCGYKFYYILREWRGCGSGWSRLTRASLHLCCSRLLLPWHKSNTSRCRLIRIYYSKVQVSVSLHFVLIRLSTAAAALSHILPHSRSEKALGDLSEAFSAISLEC